MIKKWPIATSVFFVIGFSTFVLSYWLPVPDYLIFIAKPFKGFFQGWTWFSYIFCHTDMTHLVFNLVALIVLGPVVEKKTGSLAFALYCLSTTIFTAVCATVIAPLIPFPVVFITGFTCCILMISILFAAFQPVVHLEAFGVFNISSSVIILIFGAFSFLWMIVDSFTGFFHIFHIAGYVSAGLILAIFYRMNVIKVLFPPSR